MQALYTMLFGTQAQTTNHACQVQSLRDYHLLQGKSLDDPMRVKLTQIPNRCWGTAVAAAVMDSGHLKRLARSVGEAFESVVSMECGDHRGVAFSRIKMATSVAFFFKEDGNGKSPLGRVVSVVNDLGGSESDQYALIIKVVCLLFRQDLYDPEKYVSHAMNHAIQVADYSVRLYEENREILGYFTKIVFPTGENESQAKVKALLSLCALLHDCGYPYLGALAKANHAPYGGKLTDIIKKEFIAVINQPNGIQLFDLFREAIYFHNADSRKKDFNSYVTVINQSMSIDSYVCPHERDSNLAVQRLSSTPLSFVGQELPLSVSSSLLRSEGRSLDLNYPKDEKVGLKYTPGHLDENPFHLIRIADNLDFTANRLSELQQDRIFVGLCKIRAHPEFQDQNSAACRVFDAALGVLKNCPEGSVRQIQATIVEALNEESIRHFGGCLAIQNISSIQFRGASLIVKLNCSSKWADFSHPRFHFREDGEALNVANYQLCRAKKAIQSIFLARNNPISVKFVDSSDVPLYT